MALSLAAAGCGGDDSGGRAGPPTELDGVSITVGSKDFTENILLGEMFAQALENKGANVDDKINLGGTSVNRKALTSGDIDVYPEYNGTGWTVHLGNEDPSQDPQELYDVTAEAGPAEEQHQVGRAVAVQRHLRLRRQRRPRQAGGRLRLPVDGRLPQGQPGRHGVHGDRVPRPARRPGAVGGRHRLQDAQSQIQILDTGLIYTETADGNCDFGEVFTTDGRIPALNLELVEDPGVMILYNVSFTMRNEVYEANADVYDEIADTILADLDNEKMAELNAKVDVEGQPGRAVAEDYLKEIGIL